MQVPSYLGTVLEPWKNKQCHPKALNLSSFPQLQEVTDVQLCSAHPAPALQTGPSHCITSAPSQSVCGSIAVQKGELCPAGGLEELLSAPAALLSQL